MILPRRSLSLLVALTIGLGALLSACASAPTPTPAPVPTSAVDASGQPILKVLNATPTPNPFAGWAVTITRVGRAKTISEPGLISLEAKDVWLILHLQATNGGPAASAFPRARLLVVDPAGKQYPVDDNASEHYSVGVKLPSLDKAIPPKGTIEVGAVFDVSPTAAGLKLRIGTQDIPIQE